MRLHSSVAAAALLIGSLAAHADTINFTYAGGDATGGNLATSSGSGSFTFAGDPAALTLASLTAFSLPKRRQPRITFSAVPALPIRLPI